MGEKRALLLQRIDRQQTEVVQEHKQLTTKQQTLQELNNDILNQCSLEGVKGEVNEVMKPKLCWPR